MFEFDATGIQPSTQGQGKLLPKKWFKAVIVSYITNDGSKEYPMEGYTKEHKYPKVDLLTEVTDEGEYKGVRVFHTVTFMPKEKDGSGMAIHFLKTINQPWEGKIKPNSQEWIGEEFLGYAIEDEYNGKKKNKWGEIKPVPSDKKETDDIPF